MQNTLSCPKCGATLFGDPPTLEILCNVCQEELRNAYPDGWTCIECGNEFHNEFPANYPPEEGTICKRCI
jgi:rRNA maturation protein Nop10